MRLEPRVQTPLRATLAENGQNCNRPLHCGALRDARASRAPPYGGARAWNNWEEHDKPYGGLHSSLMD
eukprot:2799197-Lingulodinium_polyedra.AAC.1